MFLFRIPLPWSILMNKGVTVNIMMIIEQTGKIYNSLGEKLTRIWDTREVCPIGLRQASKNCVTTVIKDTCRKRREVGESSGLPNCHILL